MKGKWIKNFYFWAMDIHGNVTSWCQREGNRDE